MERLVPWLNKTGYALTRPNLLAHAPPAPGVYGIFSGRTWIYFGETDDLRRRLLEHTLDRSHCMFRHPDLQFSCETTVNPVDRLAQLLLEYRTPCNSLFE